MMKSLIVFLLLTLPSTVFAGCILTEFPYSVVCSGYDPTAPPMKRINKAAKASASSGRSKSTKKASIADTEDITSVIVMTEEELKFMQASNKKDGYRTKRKPQDQLAKK
ncbi:MAG: hypothetical protein J0665_14585 [Deltaproteobacteria bacterium]|jgi:hypothetical protein|nr:hypothetical protein [Deltaproteobacteria bacterium]